MTCSRRQLVDDHFANRTDAVAEQAMREELARCPECTAWYERHLLFGQLTGTDAPRDRLMRAHGLRGTSVRWTRFLVPALVASAAVVLAVVVLPRRSTDDAFTPRGAGIHDVALDLFQVTATGSTRVGASVSAHDALAFSYQNGAGKKWLMVYAVDAAGRVYWYHPAWEDAALTPQAVAIEPGATWHELPDAVTQPLPVGRLELHALFLDDRLNVKDVEAALGQPVKGALDVVRVLEVRP